VVWVLEDGVLAGEEAQVEAGAGDSVLVVEEEEVEVGVGDGDVSPCLLFSFSR
jgi:hypothetical protein